MREGGRVGSRAASREIMDRGSGMAAMWAHKFAKGNLNIPMVSWVADQASRIISVAILDANLFRQRL